QDHQFDYGIYSKIFTGYLDMQHQIDQNPRHATKTQELQATWVSAGKYELHGCLLAIADPRSEQKPNHKL
ncbi:hypothetical protein PISMIDRAFT_96877, partial [Pisolithus microcarpus 441]